MGENERRCPRCGGSVRLERVPGSATDPNDPLPSDHHFWCSPCGKLWHPIEMPRGRTLDALERDAHAGDRGAAIQLDAYERAIGERGA